MKTNSKGFTLIELLVVIAIIGILSTIAMTSLNGARKKAADASFKSSVASVQAVAVLCCDSFSNAHLRVAASTPAVGAGTTICLDTNVAGNYPASGIGTPVVGTDCTSSGQFNIKVPVPTSGFSGACNHGTCTETGCGYFSSTDDTTKC